MLTRDQITLGILAGGQARRLGGVDKAFAQFEGRSLLTRTLDAMGTGYAQVLISYNGSDERIVEFGTSAVPDLRGHFPGPLAGLESLLHAASTEWLLTIPVDLRDIPDAIPEILCRQLGTGPEGEGVAISDADGLQPLVALWPVRAARPATTAALEAGDRAAHRLVQSMQFRIHNISPCRLGNLNTPSDFE